jgi:oxalate decarboxylase/phosphoglucose isomerase-like protein (cupin superfamily)
LSKRGAFDPASFAGELEAAPSNRELGTTLWFENDRIRVFELRLEPGGRAPFHLHDEAYFWTVVEPGRGLQRFADGTFETREYALGETRYLTASPSQPLIHDLENIGETTLRFVTVALRD